MPPSVSGRCFSFLVVSPPNAQRWLITTPNIAWVRFKPPQIWIELASAYWVRQLVGGTGNFLQQGICFPQRYTLACTIIIIMKAVFIVILALLPFVLALNVTGSNCGVCFLLCFFFLVLLYLFVIRETAPEEIVMNVHVGLLSRLLVSTIVC